MKHPEIDKKLGLCLAGGGGLGFLHVGLLEAMEELGIRPGVVAGTSSGAIFGALYAAGKSSSEIRDLLANFKWDKIIAPTLPRRGLLSTSRMEAFFRKHFGPIDVSELPIKLKIAAVDLHSGELVIFTSGPLEKCLAASCAVPGIFEPVTIGGRTCYDAGGIYNLPLELMSNEGLHTVIAGNTIGQRGLMKDPKTIQETIYQAYLIRSKTLTEWRTGPQGWAGRKKERLILIDYPTEGANPASMSECLKLITATKEEALRVLRKEFTSTQPSG